MKKKTPPIPTVVAGPIDDQANRKVFNATVGRTVENNRMFVVLFIVLISNVFLAVALYQLFPLKSVEVYMATKQDGGRVLIDSEPVGLWKPQNDEIAYALNEWASWVFTINKSTLEANIERSLARTTGAASVQLRELLDRDNPKSYLKKDPDFVRNYEFITVNFINDETALLRFKTSVPGSKTGEVTYSMTVSFIRIKPKDRKELMKNIGGIHFSSFNLQIESAK